MTPTNKLRFVERWVDVPVPGFPDNNMHKEVRRILQQWWEDNSHDVYWVNGAPGEWRDIPVEKEA